jgi:hypothetical protein
MPMIELLLILLILICSLQAILILCDLYSNGEFIGIKSCQEIIEEITSGAEELLKNGTSILS